MDFRVGSGYTQGTFEKSFLLQICYKIQGKNGQTGAKQGKNGFLGKFQNDVMEALNRL